MRYVISVGGSMIIPDEIDIGFIKKLKSIIKKSKSQFILIVGGGSIARKYQKAARVFKAGTNDLDWLGIYATWINADFVRSIFGKIAHPSIADDYSRKINFRKKILVGGGWKPGFTTDYDAALIAKHSGAKTVINLTNVDYVYDKDPNKHKNTKPFHRLTWSKMREVMGKNRIPGGHWPFDPQACRLAEKSGISVVIMNGRNLKNLENFLSGQKFKGTVIS